MDEGWDFVLDLSQVSIHDEDNDPTRDVYGDEVDF